MARSALLHCLLVMSIARLVLCDEGVSKKTDMTSQFKCTAAQFEVANSLLEVITGGDEWYEAYHENHTCQEALAAGLGEAGNLAEFFNNALEGYNTCYDVELAGCASYYAKIATLLDSFVGQSLDIRGACAKACEEEEEEEPTAATTTVAAAAAVAAPPAQTSTARPADIAPKLKCAAVTAGSVFKLPPLVKAVAEAFKDGNSPEEFFEALSVALEEVSSIMEGYAKCIRLDAPPECTTAWVEMSATLSEAASASFDLSKNYAGNCTDVHGREHGEDKNGGKEEDAASPQGWGVAVAPEAIAGIGLLAGLAVAMWTLRVEARRRVSNGLAENYVRVEG